MTPALAPGHGWLARQVPPDLAPWVDFLAPCLAGGAVLVVLAAAADRLCHRAPVRLGVWRLALVLLCLLPLLELGAATAFVSELLPPGGAAGRTAVLLRGEGGRLYTLAAPLPPPAAWPVAAWAAVAFLILARPAVAAVLLGRLRRRLMGASPSLQARFRGVLRQMRCRQVSLGTSPALRGPMVFGVWRPVLALPADFETTFTPGQQEAVLAHEVAHLANRDPFWQQVAVLAAALNWWNPLLWWGLRKHREAAEAAADESTLAIEDGPNLLAESLVLLGRRLTAGGAGGLSAVGTGRRSALARRVEHLLRLEARPPDARRARAVRVGLTGLLLAGALAGASLAHAGRTAAPLVGHEQHWRGSLLGRAWAARQDVDVHAPVRADERQLLTQRAAPTPRSDEEIMVRLGLSGEQSLAFAEMLARRDAETRELHRLKSGHVERGLEINRAWRGGLRAILTPDQYRRYLDYWGRPDGASAHFVVPLPTTRP